MLQKACFFSGEISLYFFLCLGVRQKLSIQSYNLKFLVHCWISPIESFVMLNGVKNKIEEKIQLLNKQKNLKNIEKFIKYHNYVIRVLFFI